MSKYSIGIDYGSLSGRAVLVNVETGEELASAIYEYPHAVMDETLPDGTPLGHDWALQHPQDYLDVLTHTIPEVIRGIDPGDIIGIGTDFTACTVLPVYKDGTPLCFKDEYKSTPHAYVKLWKHHAAQDKANKLNEIAEQRGENWLANYGGKISSEWAIPKLWQILDEAPEIYAEMDRWIEAADWIIWQLTGKETRNSCTAGYKEIYNKRTGYPSKEFSKRSIRALRTLWRKNWVRRSSRLARKRASLRKKWQKNLALSRASPLLWVTLTRTCAYRQSASTALARCSRSWAHPPATS